MRQLNEAWLKGFENQPLSVQRYSNFFDAPMVCSRP